MPIYVSMGRSSITSTSTNGSSYRYISPDGGSVWKGPRKICCFCSLAIVFPALLISVPLLMRFVLYGTSHHVLSPSDMKLMDQRISTTWCQAETVKINTSFTAYVTSGEPSVVETPMLLSVDKNLLIPDDHKEYWGFYLLKGSKFKIRTCARWKGGTLLVVQGRSHLEHCAYIGEADSAGDSDQVSSSNSIELLNNEIMKTHGHRSHSSEELTMLLAKFRQFIKSNPRNYGKLKKQISDWFVIDDNKSDKGQGMTQDDRDASTKSPVNILNSLMNLTMETDAYSNEDATMNQSNSGNETDTIGTDLNDKILEMILDKSFNDTIGKKFGVLNKTLALEEIPNSMETGTIHRNRRQTAEIRKKTESGENGAFEDETVDNVNSPLSDSLDGIHPRMKYLTSTTRAPKTASIWEKEHGHHMGILNDTYDPNDGSNSESESSFSSSEEALAKCEGVLGMFNLYANDDCDEEISFDDEKLSSKNALYVSSTTGIQSSLLYYEDTVNASGYYYFIFGSENEKRDNFIRAKFELERLQYQLPEPVANCTNVRECHVDFTFASSQKVVIQIPQPPPHVGDAWDQVFVAETECHPRTHLYMIFALLVPLVILLCAFQ